MREKRKAVAVKYDEGIEVPLIMAKGEGRIADKIVNEASARSIPITENTTLVDMLSIQNVGSEVPEQAWKALAQIFAFILEDK